VLIQVNILGTVSCACMCLAVDRELRRLDAAGDGREAAGPVMAVACETANTRATRRHQTRTEVNVAGQAIQFATTMLASAWRANSSTAASCGRFSKASVYPKMSCLIPAGVRRGRQYLSPVHAVSFGPRFASTERRLPLVSARAVRGAS
jgi:hypothetical protein